MEWLLLVVEEFDIVHDEGIRGWPVPVWMNVMQQRSPLYLPVVAQNNPNGSDGTSMRWARYDTK